MKYLHLSDFLVIQDEQIQQIIQYNTSRLLKAENLAIEKVQSYLVQRYDVSEEFKDMNSWNPGLTYSATDRVILDYSRFSATQSYNLNDCVVKDKSAWICMTSSIGPTSSFDGLNWSVIGEQFDIYYAKYPQPKFNYQNYYTKGDQVYWKGFTYSAVQSTNAISDTALIQYFSYDNVPTSNVFPDDYARNSGYGYWTRGITYSVPSGTPLSNSNYWTSGDNRSQMIVLSVMDIMIYQLHKSIAPKNIPELRKEAYYQACEYLKGLSDGTYNSNLPSIQPLTGLRVNFGGGTRKNNGY